MSDKPRRSVTLDEEIVDAIPEGENFSEKVREWARLEYIEDKDLVVEAETIDQMKSAIRAARAEGLSDLETIQKRHEKRFDALEELADDMLSEQEAVEEKRRERADELSIDDVAEKIGLAPYGSQTFIDDRVEKSVRTVWADKLDRDPDDVIDDLATFLSSREGEGSPA